ncbi:MAG: response regulator [Endomicrobiales bacterium]|jgi:YesN/AraC family two-component response regulator
MPEKILIVDDDDDLRQEMVCSMDEYDVVVACNGQEALKILSKPHEISLIILDVKMPGLSGTEVLKLIKKREKNMKVIMLTAFSSKDMIMESLRGQADDYLEKPVDIDKLKGVVEKLLEAKKSTDEAGESTIEQKINRVKRYIERNIFKKVSLEDAAQIVGLNPKYLSRIFGDVAGMGFMDYKLKIKIDKAKEILNTTGSTISEISDKLGFMNPESFMRIFKKVTGKTPTKYRKRKK